MYGISVIEALHSGPGVELKHTDSGPAGEISGPHDVENVERELGAAHVNKQKEVDVGCFDIGEKSWRGALEAMNKMQVASCHVIGRPTDVCVSSQSH